MSPARRYKTREPATATFRLAPAPTIGISTGTRGEYRSIPFRYVWPAELGLMAQLAGLRLRDRWDGWAREPFTSESRQHGSVWEKPAG